MDLESECCINRISYREQRKSEKMRRGHTIQYVGHPTTLTLRLLSVVHRRNHNGAK